MRRLPRLAVAPLVLALVVTACGTTSPPAATVNGTEIGQEELFDHLETLRAAAAEGLDPNLSFYAPPPGGDESVYLTAQADQALTQLILLSAFEDELVARELSPPATEAGAGVDAQFQRIVDAVGRDELGLDVGATTEEVEAAVAADLSLVDPRYLPVCVSELGGDEAVIEEATARIADGEDFAVVAEELSTLESAASGGEVGCLVPADLEASSPQAASVIMAMEDGQTTTEFPGFLVMRRGIDVTGAGESLVNGAFSSWRARALSSLDVEVLDKYGVWDATTGQVVAVS
jgi:hypothetical protein